MALSVSEIYDQGIACVLVLGTFGDPASFSAVFSLRLVRSVGVCGRRGRNAVGTGEIENEILRQYYSFRGDPTASGINCALRNVLR